MGTRTLLAGLASFATVALLATSAQATTLSGTLDVNGGVIVGPNYIDFTPAGGGTGLENIALTSTFTVGGVLVAPGSNLVVAKDLDGALYPTTGFTNYLDFYEQLNQFPTVNFQLQDILSCSELGGGLTCPAGPTSPFGFSETAGGTTVTMITRGQVWDTNTPLEVYNFTAIYTAQFVGLSVAQLQALLASQGFISTSFSASKLTVTSAVPEPASLVLLGAGLLATAFHVRRRRRANA